MKNAIVFVILALVLHGGCKKSDDADGVVTITGRIVKDCSLLPMSALRLLFYTTEGRAFSGERTIELGYDTTDADGRFSIIVPNKNLENIAMVWEPTSSREDEVVIVPGYAWPQKPESGKSYDWGYVWFGGQSPETRIDANLRFDQTTFAGADSIFFGIQKAHPIVVSAKAAVYWLNIPSGRSSRPSTMADSLNLYWATRRSAFDSSFETYGANAAFKARKASVPRYQCNFGTTAEISIR